MLRRMTVADVPELVGLHLASWSPEELSVKLGAPYLRSFYGEIAHASDAFTYVWERKGRIVGCATGFQNYTVFNQRLRARHFFALAGLIAWRLMTRRLSLADLRNLMGDERKLHRLRYPDVHWGATALAAEFKGTPLGREALVGTVQAVFRDLRQAGKGGCWGACDARNIAMIKWLERLGFDEVETLHESGRRVIVYELDFDEARFW